MILQVSSGQGGGWMESLRHYCHGCAVCVPGAEEDPDIVQPSGFSWPWLSREMLLTLKL